MRELGEIDRVEADVVGLGEPGSQAVQVVQFRRVDASGHEPSKQTSKIMDLLQATFGLADDEVARAHAES